MIQKTKSITDVPNYRTLVPMVELHSSLWLEDMRNYTVNDFIGHGIVAQNPDILKGDAEIIRKLKMSMWNVVPMLKNFVERGLGLQNYIYLYDTENGLDIFHHEPLRNSPYDKENKRNTTGIFHTTFTQFPTE
jgi:hypothetical protein